MDRILAFIAFLLFATTAQAQTNLGNVPTDRLLGRDTAGSGQVEALTVGGAMSFTGTKGVTVTGANILTQLLTVDGSGSGLDADLLDGISSSGFQASDTELTCLAGLTSAADKFPYFTGSGTCALADISSAERTFLTTPTSANFGSVVSDDAFLLSDAELGAIAGLVSAADKGIYFTGSGTASMFDLSSTMRTWHTTQSVANLASVLTDEAAGWANWQTTPSSANLATYMTDEAFSMADIELGAIAGLTSAADKLPYFTGSGTAALADLSSAMRTWFTTSSCANLASVTTDETFNCADAELGAIAGLVSAADKGIYFTGSGTAAMFDLSSTMRTWHTTQSVANLASVLTDEATGWANWQTTPSSANLATYMTDEAFTMSDAELGAIAGLVSAADKGIYFTGSGTAAMFDLSSAERTFLTTPSSANLGSVVSDDQFLLSDVELGSIAGLVSAADRLPYFTGSGTASLATYTAAARTLDALADPNLDAIPFWDDSASTYKWTALADLNTNASPAAGDYFLMVNSAGATVKVNWSSLPASGSSSTGNFSTYSLLGGM